MKHLRAALGQTTRDKVKTYQKKGRLVFQGQVKFGVGTRVFQDGDLVNEPAATTRSDFWGVQIETGFAALLSKKAKSEEPTTEEIDWEFFECWRWQAVEGHSIRVASSGLP